MLIGTGSLTISYYQIVLFDSEVEDPFNDWTPKHCDQGFSWRPGSVAFSTIDDFAKCYVDVCVSSAQNLPDPQAQRVIQTPFRISSAGSVSVVSVLTEPIVFQLQAGQYDLQYQAFPPFGELEGRIKFVFTRTETPSFAILRADAGLKLDGELLLTAEPA